MQKLAGVPRIGAAEFRECPEEMVVSGHALRGDEAAHRKRIDQIVVESLVFGYVGGGNIAGLTHGRGLGSRLDRLRFSEGLRGRIYAETVFAADADEGLGIDRAVEMIVQIGALRHALEELAKSQRIAADGIELLARAQLAFGRLPLRRRRSGQDQRREHNGNEGGTDGAHSVMLIAQWTAGCRRLIRPSADTRHVLSRRSRFS